MSGPKRTADKLNTIGIVVVGICSAVLVYVTIVALQAFYMDDTSEIQMMADYGGQDTQAKTIKAEQTGAINRSSMPNAGPKVPTDVQTYRIPIKVAMEKVVADAKKDCSAELVPAVGPSVCRTTEPEFGRPKAEEKKPCAEWGKGEPPKHRCMGGTPVATPPGDEGVVPTPAPTNGPAGQPANNPKGDGR